LTGYEGNGKFIDPEIPTIALGEVGISGSINLLFSSYPVNLYLLTGYEGNGKFIDPEIPTIARSEAD
jgi:hypothetical protein